MNLQSKTIAIARALVTLLMCFAFSASLFAQVSAYTFSETTGSYSPISGGQQLATTTGGVTTFDTDGNNISLPVGSQFSFNNAIITSVNMTADGSLWLNPATTTTGNGVTGPISSTAVSAGVIAAMGMDLRSTSIASQVYERRWQDIGSELVFQWQNCSRFGQGGVERFSFQIRINKTNNEIRIVYGEMVTIANSTTYIPAVGLRGTTNADYNARRLTNSVPDATPNWGAPNGTSAATSNAHTVRFTSQASCFPSSGLTFIWTPPFCSQLPSSLSASSITATSATVSWTAASPLPASGYQYFISTTNTAPIASTTPTGSTAAGVTSVNLTGLISNTTYYIWVRSNCDGTNFSSWTSVLNFTTLLSPCTGTPSPGNTLASPSTVVGGSSTTLSLQNATTGSGVSYQWQSSSDNATWNNIAGATASTYVATPSANTYYRCIVICGGNSGTSNAVLVTVTYCTPVGGTTYFISNFSTTGGLTNINNTSGSSVSGYTNYSGTVSCSQYAGSSVTFTINTGNNSATYYYYLWIDWNNDFDFADANETILATTSFVAPPSVSSITVPAGTPPGNYRMRTAISWSGTITSCTGNANAEYEDYTFIVPVLTPCSGVPAPGNTLASSTTVISGGTTNLSVQNATIGSGVTYQWQSSSDNTTWANIAGATSSTYVATLFTSTYYRCIVTCGGNSGTSNAVMVTVSYCTSTATGTTYYITSFATTSGVSNINNVTNAISTNGYGNFTAQSASQYAGGTMNFSTGLLGAGSYGLAIFIDWNNNLSFADAGEKVYTTSSYQVSPIAGSFTIPAGQAVGNYRMRVVANYYSSAPAACNSMSDGETEDYTFSVIAPSVCSGTPPGGTAITSPVTGTVSSTFTLSATGLTSLSGLTYQWQSSPNGTSWTNIAGATTNPYTATAVNTITTTYYRLAVLCTASGLTGYSSTATYVTNYCIPAFTSACTSNDYINSFTINTLSNLNSGCNGNPSNYIQYPPSGSNTTTLTQGVAYNATINIGRGGSGNVAIWIDYNNNNIFETTERYVNTTLVALSGTVIIPVSVPSGALLGSRRLRVMEVYSTTLAVLDPCASYTFGETEDYTITIIANAPCAGTPVPGNTIANQSNVCTGSIANLSLQNQVTGSGVSYQWQSSSDNVTYANIPGANAAAYSPIVNVNTWYRCVVTCSGNSGTSTAIQITCSPCVLMPSSGNSSVNTCSANFYDSGGLLGNYNNNESGVITIYPTTPGSFVRITFSSFEVETCCDNLRIYNGNAVTAPLIGTYTTLPGVITSSAADGSLTLVFTSDGSVVATGWEAVISCYVPPLCTGIPDPGATLSNNSFVCNNSSTVLSVSNPPTGSGVSYQWQSAPDVAGAPGTFNNVVGANSPTFTYTPTAAATVWYRCSVTCSGNSVNSSPVQIVSAACNIINMSNGSTNTCAAQFYDNGGSAGNYGDNQSLTYTIFPSTPGAKVRVSFNSFSVESCCDNLKIYDGNSVAALLLGVYTSNPGTITSTAADGSLTFVFTSDGSINRAGWDATISCFIPPPCTSILVGGAAATSPSTGQAGSAFTLNATGFSAVSGLTFQWQSSPDGVNWTNINGATTIPYNMTAPGVAGVIKVTYYQLQITCPSTNSTVISAPTTFTTASYCIPSHSSPSSTYMTKISFLGTLNDVTNFSTYSSTGYQDFTTLSDRAKQAQGEGVNLYIQSNTSAFMNGWADWNSDGVFDASEKIFTSGDILAFSSTFGFVIPIATPPGNYRIRIRTNTTSSTHNACSNLSNGETEDYLITVIPTCNITINGVTNGSVCGSGQVDLSVSATAGATQYFWYTLPTGGVPAAITNTPNWTTPSIRNTTYYYVTASNGICESITRTIVKAFVNTIPVLTFTPNNPIVCGEGAVLRLNASGDFEEVTLLNENFENGLGAFTVNNILSGANVNLTQWQIITSTYIPMNTAVWHPAISSGVGSNRFVYTTSDFSGTSVNTALVTPAVNSTNFTSLYMDFSIYYSHYLTDGDVSGTDSVLIEASTNNGTTWSRVDYYISDQGIGTRFNDNTVDLSAYINQPNLRVRIRYRAFWSDGVAVDDIRIYGFKPLTSTFSWSPINQNNLFIDSAGTIPYTGSSVAQIYIRPTVIQLDTASTMTFFATATLSNGCSATSPVAVSIIPSQWTGDISTDWHNALNWCSKAVPLQTTKVELPAGLTRYPIINAPAFASTIKIFTGASLTITNNGSFTVRGNFDNLGTLTNNGRIELNGSNAQNFPGSTGTINAMSILHLNNTGPGVILNKSINIERELRPTSGVLALGNFDVTIKSSLARTASVSKIGFNSGFTYGTGRFIVERYIPTGVNHGKSWQLLAVSTNGGQTINSAWQEASAAPNQNLVPGFGTQITGEMANATSLGFDVYSPVGPSMKFLNTLGTWTGVASTLNTPLYNSKGYMIFVRGDRSVINFSGAGSAPVPTILRNRGKLFDQSSNPPPVINVLPGKFESVGNPYASAIDFANPDGVIFDGPPNIDNAFYVWDPTLSGSQGLGGYQTMSGLLDWKPNPGGTTNYPVNVPNSRISSGQAFLVRGGALGGQLSFTEDAKVDSSRLNLRMARPGVSNILNDEKQILFTRLYAESNGNSVLADGHALVFHADLSNELNSDDAIKMNNSGENLGIFAHNNVLSIEARYLAALTDSIQFRTSNLRAIQYRLEFAPESLDQCNYQPYLYDRHTQVYQEIALRGITNYNFSVSSGNSSAAANRFVIVFRKKVPVKLITIRGRRINNQMNQLDFSFNENNLVEKYMVEKSTDCSHFEQSGTVVSVSKQGDINYIFNDEHQDAYQDVFYRVVAKLKDGTSVYSDVVCVSENRVLPIIKIIGPVVKSSRRIQLQFESMPQGVHDYAIFQSSGQCFQVGKIVCSGVKENKVIETNHSLPSGVYEIRFSNHEAFNHSVKFIVN